MDKKEKIIAGAGIATVLGIAGYEYVKSKKTTTSSSSTTTTTSSTSSTSSTTQPTKTTTSSTTSGSSTTSSSTTTKTSSTQTVTINIYGAIAGTKICYFDQNGQPTCVGPVHQIIAKKDSYIIIFVPNSFYGTIIGAFTADYSGSIGINGPFCAGFTPIVNANVPNPLYPHCGGGPTVTVTIKNNYLPPVNYNPPGTRYVCTTVTGFNNEPIGTNCFYLPPPGQIAYNSPGSGPVHVSYIDGKFESQNIIIAPGQTVKINALLFSDITVNPGQMASITVQAMSNNISIETNYECPDVFTVTPANTVTYPSLTAPVVKIKNGTAIITANFTCDVYKRLSGQ